MSERKGHPSPQLIDLTGKRFGNLLVWSRGKSIKQETYWARANTLKSDFSLEQLERIVKVLREKMVERNLLNLGDRCA